LKEQANAGGTATATRPSTGHGDESLDLRSRILAAAIDALERGGEQAVRIRDITEGLGISVGAIYHHFHSREGLIVAARIQQFAGAAFDDNVRIRAFVEAAETPEQVLAGVLETVRRVHSPERATNRRLRAEVIGVARHNADLERALADAQRARTNEVTEVVELAQQKGFVDASLDARAVATLLQAVALGKVLDDVNGDEPVDQDAWVSVMTRVWHALTPG
jgi:AcrR family transcriptional regulator